LTVATLAVSFDPSAPQWQFWTSIASLLVALLTLAVSVWLFALSRQHKLLSYEIVSNASLVNVHKDLGEAIKVTLSDDGEEIGEARILVIRLTNAGNTTIEASDFSSNERDQVRLAFVPDAVLRCGVQKIEPPDHFDEETLKTLLTIGPDHQDVRLVPLPLGPKTSITLKILTRGAAELKVYGHISGGKIVKARPQPRGSLRKTALAGTGVFLAGILISPAFSPLLAYFRGDCALGSILVGGSSAFLKPILAAADQYQMTCPVSEIRVLPEISGAGLEKLKRGSIQIASSELPHSVVQADHGVLVANPIGIIRFVMIVRSDITGFDTLTGHQLHEIYAGKLNNWQQLHGPDQQITSVGRASTSSGTRTAFERHVLGEQLRLRAAIEKDSTDAVAQAVRDTPGAIGYVDLDTALAYAATSKVRLVTIDGADPSVENVKAGRYTFWAIESMYTKASPPALVTSFIQHAKAHLAHDDGFISFDWISPAILRAHE
jgi:phosphate transport system substrate-binding protein